MQTLPRPPASALRANAVPRSLVAAAAGVAFRYAASPRLSSARGTEVHVPSFTHLHSLPSSLNSAKWLTTFPSLAVNFVRHKRREAAVQAYPPNPSAPPSPFPFPEGESAADKAKLSQVAKRLESTSRHFKRLGTLGFWGQLVCTTVAAVILSFSTIATGKVTSPGTFYATAAGIAAAFVSVFWSFGYIRLSERLRRTANEPAKAPPRAEVVKSLQNGIVVNLLGMGAAILGMQATVGLLVAKALTTSSVPYYQGLTPGQSPVLALDVFLVQELKSLKMIGSSLGKGDLYFFLGECPSCLPCQSRSTYLSNSPLLWHCHYGHPSLDTLGKREPNLSSLSTLECLSCQFGKHHLVLPKSCQ